MAMDTAFSSFDINVSDDNPLAQSPPGVSELLLDKV